MSKRRAAIRGAGALLLVGVVTAAALFGYGLGRQMLRNEQCCAIPWSRNLIVSAREMFRLVRYPSQIGQDKWVTQSVFPGVTDGFFVDVGSGDGTLLSNTKALEQLGWRGVCIDPFPTNMEDRRCQIFKEVVSSEAGKRVTFRVAGDLGGIVDTLGRWKDDASGSRVVEFSTVALGDILARAHAPRFIHFVSLDIEGAELDALRGFPFAEYSFGALAVEHNFEEPKRSQIRALLESHGYARVHEWQQDDFYVPAATAPRR